jgi:hypothetical protein
VSCRVASCPMLNIVFINKSAKLFKKCFLFGFDYRSKWNMLLMGRKQGS